MPKYAIIQSGGRQYRVEEGQELVVEQGPDLKDGDPVQFDQVLLVHDEQGEAVGTPYLSGAAVAGKVLSSFRGEKIVGFKYKPKKRYRRRWGYRAQLTKLLIQEIRR
jgi:large subunit ribosomal protein L21